LINHHEAIEIMNNGFLKVFSDPQKHNFQKPLKAWPGRILIHAAIEYYRSDFNELATDNIEDTDVTRDYPLEDCHLTCK
jgi:DNA-directed RNA polymerase specialized sigma24 family protein